MVKVNKKGQIGALILCGLIILIGFSFVIYLKNNDIGEADIGKTSNALFDIIFIKSYVQNCIEGTAKNSLIFIGKQGGYYEVKKPYLKDENFMLPYYLFNNIDFSPSIKDIEKEISRYIDDNLQLCVKGFDEFKIQGFEINQNKPKSKTKIASNSVSFDVDFPIIIKKGENTQKIENFNFAVEDFHLQNIHKVSKEITAIQYNEPNKLCISCIYDLAETNDLYIGINNYGNNSLIFAVKDYNITEDTILKSPFNFTFAIKYEGISCDKLSTIEDPDILQECIEKRTKI